MNKFYKIVLPLCFLMPTLSDASEGQTEAVALNAIAPDTIARFVQVIDVVRRQYAGNVNDEQLMTGAMRGVLASLDGHAEFLDEQALEQLTAFTEGSIADVGLELSFNDAQEQWIVLSIAPESDAKSKGVVVGDYVHQLNGRALAGLDQKQVQQLLSGIAGSQLSIVLSHAGRDKRTLLLQRTTPSKEKLSVSLVGELAVVHLPVFTEHTRDELLEALAVISTPIKGMVLDIRNNPGGVLSSAVAVASLFTKQEVLVQVNEQGKPIKKLGSIGQAHLDAMPIVVLQNRYSASASEVLAQALKADKQSVVVGETSYGKGSVQSVIPLGDQAVKLTTAHYLGANGEVIDGVGVAPSVAFDANADMLTEALELLKTKELPVGMMVSLPSDY